jgi:hypothetical protein
MVKGIRLLALFYAMYFLGHLSMSTVYRLGTTATTVFGCASLAAIIFTLWKAAGRSESVKECIYGIVAGFFIWCFAGEFLEHEGILELAALKAAPLLILFLLTTSLTLYKQSLPMGIRFALGHFASVWLLHFILVNQAEILQFTYPELFKTTITLTGFVFFLTALFTIVKTLITQSERGFLAYLLSSFILVWATVETLQVMHIVPDYTYYTYWRRKLSPATKPVSLSEKANKKIELIRKRYVWGSKQMQDHACSFLKRLPSPQFLDDFSIRLERTMQKRNRKNIDAALFYQTIKKSFVTTTTSSFDDLLKATVQQFKEDISQNRDQYEVALVQQNPFQMQTSSAEKLTFIREHYRWENNLTLELACHLLSKFSIQFLSSNEFIRRLDNKLVQAKKSTVDENLLCQVMRESFKASTETVFTNLVKIHVQAPLKETIL